MVSKRGRIVSLVRDIVVTLLSVVIVGSQWGRWGEEGGAVFLVTSGIAGVFIVLCLVDVALIAIRVKSRLYFLFNSSFQIIPGLLFTAIFPPFVVVVLLNILTLVFLRQKKSAEEIAAHPPVQRTTTYKWVESIAALVMLGSMFLPVVNTSDATLSLFGFYLALATHSGLPGLSIEPLNVIFALLAIVLSPVAVVVAVFGLKKRKMSLVAGILAIVGGLGMVEVLGSDTGLGSYVMAVGGALALVAFIFLRPKSQKP